MRCRPRATLTDFVSPGCTLNTILPSTKTSNVPRVSLLTWNSTDELGSGLVLVGVLVLGGAGIVRVGVRLGGIVGRGDLVVVGVGISVGGRRVRVGVDVSGGR